MMWTGFVTPELMFAGMLLLLLTAGWFGGVFLLSTKKIDLGFLAIFSGFGLIFGWIALFDKLIGG